MKNKTIINNILLDITESLLNDNRETHQIGCLSGKAGIAMYLAYYAHFFGGTKEYEYAQKLLYECVENIHGGNLESTFCSGISGFYWVLDHLNNIGFIESDLDLFGPHFDTYLKNELFKEFDRNNYDFLHGALGICNYFYLRYQNAKSNGIKKEYEDIILESIDKLNTISIKEEDNCLKWNSHFMDNQSDCIVNFGLSHGMPSIITFLTKLSSHESFKSDCEPLVKNGIDFLLKYKNVESRHISKYPSWISENMDDAKESRLAWCYGDLGLGVMFWLAGQEFNEAKYMQESLEIFDFCAMRKTEIDTKVVDSAICHGSFGNAQVFNWINKKVGNDRYRKAIDFWIEDGISRKDSITKDYSGYVYWDAGEKTWEKSNGILEGISGIGMVLIEYLTGHCLRWDDCLLLK